MNITVMLQERIPIHHQDGQRLQFEIFRTILQALGRYCGRNTQRAYKKKEEAML